MRVAVKTLEAIELALNADQGAKYRGLLRHAMPLAEDAYSEDNEPFRTHLGASLIGRKCSRELWYSFHWATLKNFDGRMLRLFNRGHLEEPRFVALLQMIGCRVHQYDANGKQFRIAGYMGHYGGSLDAVIEGCPDIPNTPILGEFKTHGEKSFIKLKEAGVMSAKWEHFIQMQQYMGHYQLPFALYGAVNKNTDELHLELIAFDQAQCTRYNDRSVSIIDARTPPAKINSSPGWYECKFCDHHAVCHSDATPAKNCRTCRHGVPVTDGRWVCIAPNGTEERATIGISKSVQFTGCSIYEMLPAIKEK